MTHKIDFMTLTGKNPPSVKLNWAAALDFREGERGKWGLGRGNHFPLSRILWQASGWASAYSRLQVNASLTVGSGPWASFILMTNSCWLFIKYLLTWPWLLFLHVEFLVRFEWQVTCVWGLVVGVCVVERNCGGAGLAIRALWFLPGPLQTFWSNNEEQHPGGWKKHPCQRGWVSFSLVPASLWATVPFTAQRALLLGLKAQVHGPFKCPVLAILVYKELILETVLGLGAEF